MRPLSAIDAIGPAWSHTRRLLLDKRDWRLMLKIGAVAIFAGIGGISGGSFPNMGNFGNMNHTGSTPHWPASAAAIIAAIAAIAVVLFAVFFVIFLIMLYIGSRLQFVLFEVVLRSDTTIAPIWRRYGAATWRWIGLRLIFMIAAFLCVAPVLIPAIVQFVHMLHQAGNQPPNIGVLIATFFGLFAMAFLVALIFGIIKILMHDFGLPSMAMESTSISETIARVWRLVRAEPGQAALFILMRFILGLAGAWGANLVVLIAAFVALIPLGIVALLDYLLLHSAGHAGFAAMVVIWVILGLVWIAFLFIATFIVLGYLITFIQAYALYFLGGRYPLLGQYLAPFWPATHNAVPPPPAFQPPPAPPAPTTPPANEPPPAPPAPPASNPPVG
jgi:hypothetical protein